MRPLPLISHILICAQQHNFTNVIVRFLHWRAHDVSHMSLHHNWWPLQYLQQEVERRLKQKCIDQTIRAYKYIISALEYICYQCIYFLHCNQWIAAHYISNISHKVALTHQNWLNRNRIRKSSTDMNCKLKKLRCLLCSANRGIADPRSTNTVITPCHGQHTFMCNAVQCHSNMLFDGWILFDFIDYMLKCCRVIVWLCISASSLGLNAFDNRVYQRHWTKRLLIFTIFVQYIIDHTYRNWDLRSLEGWWPHNPSHLFNMNISSDFSQDDWCVNVLHHYRSGCYA